MTNLAFVLCPVLFRLRGVVAIPGSGFDRRLLTRTVQRIPILVVASVAHINAPPSRPPP